MRLIVSRLALWLAVVATSACAVGSAETAQPRKADHQHDHGDVTMQVHIEPTCVAPGDEMTIEVETSEPTGVLYLAHYSDGGSGARDPIGAGYGGNGSGFTDPEGRFADRWTVAANAPTGRGWVQIVTTSDQQDEIEFTVIDPGDRSC